MSRLTSSSSRPLVVLLVLCLTVSLPTRTAAWAPPARLSPLRTSSFTTLTRHMVANDKTLVTTDIDMDTTEVTPSSLLVETDGALTANAQETLALTNKMSLWTNGVIIGTIGLVTAYTLTHQHVEALMALWEYDLGELTSPEVTKAAVAMEVLTRLPVDWVRSYEALIPTNPIFYKACTSGVAYALGDFLSQCLQGNRLEEIDLPRSARSGAAGFIGHGPLCHYWLLTMENYLDFGGAWWATGIKVTADLTVWSIFLNAAYSLIIGTLAGRKPDEVWKDIQATQWPALRSAWRFWPFVHTVSFSHAVPLDLKLLWVDVMEVVWVTILSKVANEDKNAQLEQQEHDGEATIMEAAAVAVEEPNDPATLLKKGWNAAWPLVAMWPVLYAGYQLEHVLGLVE